MTIWSELSAGHRRSLRAAVAAILAVAFSLLFMPPARAESMTVIAGEHAWFWESNSATAVCIRDPVRGLCGTIQTGDGIKEASGGSGPALPITLGHMGVSMKNGGSDMRSYVIFNLGDELPPGAEISSMIVSLLVSSPTPDHTERHSETATESGTQSTQVKPPATANQNAAGIMACAVTEPWAFAHGEPRYTTTVKRPAPEDDDPSNDETEVVVEVVEPFSDCSLNATGEVSKDGTKWTFDITNIAKKWSTLEVFNNGIALLPFERGVSPNWTVEFHGAPTERRVGTEDDGDPIDVHYVTKKEAARATVEFTGGGFEIPPPPPPVVPPSGGGFTPPAFTPPTGPVTPPPAITPPVTPPAGGGPAVPVGGKGSTNAWVFALIPLGLLGFGLVSSAVGPDPIAVAAGSGNRVARVLRERRLAGGEALGEAAAIAEEEIT